MRALNILGALEYYEKHIFCQDRFAVFQRYGFSIVGSTQRGLGGFWSDSHG